MKKNISMIAILLIFSFISVDAPVMAGGGPIERVPTVRRPVTKKPAQKKAPAPAAAPVTPATTPAAAPAETAAPAVEGSAIGPMDCGMSPYGSCMGEYGSYGGGYGSCMGECSSDNYRRCSSGVTVVVDVNDNRCAGRCGNSCGIAGYSRYSAINRAMRLMSYGNFAGARMTLRNMNRAIYFGDYGMSYR